MSWIFQTSPPVTAKISLTNVLKESLPLAVFFLVIAVSLTLTPSGMEILNLLRQSRLKSRMADCGDMFLLRPQSSDEAFRFEEASMEPSTEMTRSSKQRFRPETMPSSEMEIRHSLLAAEDFAVQGKLEKAERVFQHVLASHPSHPDVLTAYGRFLEEGYDDVVQAEHLYSKALISAPAHEKAAERRRRTLPLVEEIDQRNFDRISAKQKRLRRVPRHNPGLRRAKIEAYIQHIYHTNAMEGNTMTLMQTRAVVESGVAVGGKSVYEHNEILGMDAALQYINKTLLHHPRYISLEDILQIHKRILGFVNMEEAGVFRRAQVFVGSHRPPPAAELTGLVNEFVEWLNSEREEQESLHPLELAALAHYKFVFIHPFYDGNGRMSRLLMNLILMQAGYPPVIINVEDKHEYYQTLQMANDGDVRPFIRFVADCTDRTLDHYLAASSSTSGMSIPGLVSRKASQSWTFTTTRDSSGARKIVLQEAPSADDVVETGTSADGIVYEDDVDDEDADEVSYE